MGNTRYQQKENVYSGSIKIKKKVWESYLYPRFTKCDFTSHYGWRSSSSRSSRCTSRRCIPQVHSNVKISCRHCWHNRLSRYSRLRIGTNRIVLCIGCWKGSHKQKLVEQPCKRKVNHEGGCDITINKHLVEAPLLVHSWFLQRNTIHENEIAGQEIQRKKEWHAFN